MQVSIKMLKLYCYDLRGCMLSRSSDCFHPFLDGNFEFELILRQL